ncbi:hypothetical protein [Streptomyces sp. SID3343]|uniref:hypothetical protein n=1 Tax=Streptomyces sp. SID3343 TaxID=2690260 RepID=UPI00136A6D3F|nr:hypothetical protein [Streptomyces sp. SID3343]MYV97521.1 hypothetical protein [Streptomyces sp. SID3343]
MHPSPGDVVYAFVKKKPWGRRRVSVRFGIQKPVLRVSSWSATDPYGNDWILVLPVVRGVLDTPLDPAALVRLPVDNVCAYKTTLGEAEYDAVDTIFHGRHPRYPWIDIRADDPDASRRVSQPVPPAGTRPPTLREVWNDATQ